MTQTNRRILLKTIPQGHLEASHFGIDETPVPKPADGEVLVRALYVSLDAANRAWMQGATYRSALGAGEVMAGGALAEVVESRADHLAPGDLVFADTGWQEYAAVPGQAAAEAAEDGAAHPPAQRLRRHRAHRLFRPARVRRPKAGETVVVSAAAGAVGSIVGQIAKIKGCRT